MSEKKETRLRRARKARLKMRELEVVRLCVYRSSQHIYAQVISADGGKVLASASTLDKELRDGATGNVEAAKKVDRLRLYAPQEAIALLREVSTVKFDPTVEVHIRTGVDPRHADQMIRGSVVLPAGTGKKVRGHGRNLLDPVDLGLRRPGRGLEWLDSLPTAQVRPVICPSNGPDIALERDGFRRARVRPGASVAPVHVDDRSAADPPGRRSRGSTPAARRRSRGGRCDGVVVVRHPRLPPP